MEEKKIDLNNKIFQGKSAEETIKILLAEIKNLESFNGQLKEKIYEWIERVRQHYKQKIREIKTQNPSQRQEEKFEFSDVFTEEEAICFLREKLPNSTPKERLPFAALLELSKPALTFAVIHIIASGMSITEYFKEFSKRPSSAEDNAAEEENEKQIAIKNTFFFLSDFLAQNDSVAMPAEEILAHLLPLEPMIKNGHFDTALLANFYLHIGINHYAVGNFKAGLAVCLEALSLVQDDQHADISVVPILTNIAIGYGELDDPAKALLYAEQAKIAFDNELPVDRFLAEEYFSERENSDLTHLPLDLSDIAEEEKAEMDSGFFSDAQNVVSECDTSDELRDRYAEVFEFFSPDNSANKKQEETSESEDIFTPLPNFSAQLGRRRKKIRSRANSDDFMPMSASDEEDSDGVMQGDVSEAGSQHSESADVFTALPTFSAGRDGREKTVRSRANTEDFMPAPNSGEEDSDGFMLGDVSEPGVDEGDENLPGLNSWLAAEAKAFSSEDEFQAEEVKSVFVVDPKTQTDDCLEKLKTLEKTHPAAGHIMRAVVYLAPCEDVMLSWITSQKQTLEILKSFSSAEIESALKILVDNKFLLFNREKSPICIRVVDAEKQALMFQYFKNTPAHKAHIQAATKWLSNISQHKSDNQADYRAWHRLLLLHVDSFIEHNCSDFDETHLLSLASVYGELFRPNKKRICLCNALKKCVDPDGKRQKAISSEISSVDLKINDMRKKVQSYVDNSEEIGSEATMVAKTVAVAALHSMLDENEPALENARMAWKKLKRLSPDHPMREKCEAELLFLFGEKVREEALVGNLAGAEDQPKKPEETKKLLTEEVVNKENLDPGVINQPPKKSLEEPFPSSVASKAGSGFFNLKQGQSKPTRQSPVASKPQPPPRPRWNPPTKAIKK